MLYDITYMWNLKYETNEFPYETDRLTDVEIDLWLPRGGKSRWTGISGLAGVKNRRILLFQRHCWELCLAFFTIYRRRANKLRII